MEKNLTKFKIISKIINEGVKEKYQDFSLDEIDFDIIEELVNSYYAGMLTKERLDELVVSLFDLEDKKQKGEF